MDSLVIHAIAFPEGNLWIAQCLEYDFVSCARIREELHTALLRQISGQIRVDLGNGHEPFFGFKPAPAKYWRMLEKARLLSQPSERRERLAERIVETHLYQG